MPPTFAGSSLAAPVPTVANPGGYSLPRSPSKGAEEGICEVIATNIILIAAAVHDLALAKGFASQPWQVTAQRAR